MLNISAALLAIMQSEHRDLMWVYELYPHDYNKYMGQAFDQSAEGEEICYHPRHAIALFAAQEFSFDDPVAGTLTYRRLVVSKPSFKKRKGNEFDNASVEFSNVDANRWIASFVLNNRVEGMRLVVRLMSKSCSALSLTDRYLQSRGPTAVTDSIVYFTGICNKPTGFDREKGTISAKEEFGALPQQFPPAKYEPKCWLTYKKGGCLGNETLADKTPEYRAARICEKTEAACIFRGNRKFFQGTQIVQISSSFKHKGHHGLFHRFIHALAVGVTFGLGFRRHGTSVSDSTHDGTPYGQVIPVILGRWKKKLTALQFKDTGETIWFKMAACRGLISDFLEINNESPNFSEPMAIVKHLGDWGGTGTQTQDTVFPDHSYHSKLAYIIGRVIGSDVEVEDPAPTITSVIAGLICKTPFGVDLDGRGVIIDNLAVGYWYNLFSYSGMRWSDNPVNQVRQLLCDPDYLGMSELFIAQRETAITAAWCAGVVRDRSNGERVLLPNTEDPLNTAWEGPKAGVDYKRYTSTGLVSGLTFLQGGISQPSPVGVPNTEATYEYFDPEAPPTELDVQTVYRLRYTCNTELAEQKKVVDVIHDNIMPTFRGFTRYDRYGRVVVDCEKPADQTSLREAPSPGATTIKVWDITPWCGPATANGTFRKYGDPLQGKLLISAYHQNSEVRRATFVRPSADGNDFEYSVSSSGSASLTPVGSNFTGGTSSVAATGRVTASGQFAVGDTYSITVTIGTESWTVEITMNEQDFLAGNAYGFGALHTYILALRFSTAINAEPGLKDKVQAGMYDGFSTDTNIVLQAKLGEFVLEKPLEEQHYVQLDPPVTAPSVVAGVLPAGNVGLPAGTYLLCYAWRNPNGVTTASDITSVDVATDGKIDVGSLGALPAGVHSVDWYMSNGSPTPYQVTNLGTMLLVANNNGSAFTITERPDTILAPESPKQNTTGEKIFRVAKSFAHKRLAYADVLRSNVVDGTFQWPDAEKSDQTNQVTAEYTNVAFDFAKHPVTVNDERDQEITGRTTSDDMDLTAVDNANQTIRLMNARLAVLRDGDFFFGFSGKGDSLVLEIGELVCASDDSGKWRNVPMTIEAADYSAEFAVGFGCRIYADSMYDDEVLQQQVGLPSALVAYMAPPPAPTANVLEQVGTYGPNETYDTKISGTVTLGASSYGQKVNVYVTPPGGTEYLAQTGLKADADGLVHYEIAAPEQGDYTVRVVALSNLGVPGGEISTVITVGPLVQTIYPPTNVAADIIGGRAVVNWDPPATAPERVTGYVVYEADGVTVLMGHAKVLEWQDPRVAGTYTVKVAAQDSMGNESTQVSVTYTTTAAAGASDLHALVFDFDGGGTALSTTADPACIPRVPWNCKILSWTVNEVTGTAGTITIDIRSDTYANFPPTGADSITGSGTKPGIASSAVKDTGSNFSGWASVPPTLTKDQTLYAVITAVGGTCKHVVLELQVQET